MERRAVVLGVGGVALTISAIWFAGSWVADPPDGTCSSVLHPGTWLDRDGCVAVMSMRSLVSLGIAGLGLGVISLAVRDRLRAAERLALLAVVVATGALVVNEAVRDGGLLM
jgi:hypothetical protein